MNNTKKICLGTVKYGTDYGLLRTQKITQDQANLVLQTAYSAGLKHLDTARGYGDSEEVLGNFLNHYPQYRFIITSKLPTCYPNEVASIFIESLSRLKQNNIYGYFVHNAPHLINYPDIWNELETIKQQGKVQKIGVSVYYPEELDTLLRMNIIPEIVQLPLNIFDQRFISSIKKLSEMNIEIYARSIFLQGLLLLDLNQIPSYLSAVKPYIKKLKTLAANLQMSVAELCFGFVKNQAISKLVIGISSPETLEKNIRLSHRPNLSTQVMQNLTQLAIDNEQILVPKNWQKTQRLY